jgi:Flp pilus assembly protein TadG
MRRIITNSIRRFGANQDGAAALEFAIVSIPLFALILASLQTAIVFFEDEALQTATYKSARQLMTGSAQQAGMTQSQFQTAVCANAPSFNCGNIMVDVESASSFSSISTSPLQPTYNGSGQVTNTWSYNPGGPGDIVIIRVMYDWPVVGGPLGFNLGTQANGTYLLVGTAVTKNEPY